MPIMPAWIWPGLDELTAFISRDADATTSETQPAPSTGQHGPLDSNGHMHIAPAHTPSK